MTHGRVQDRILVVWALLLILAGAIFNETTLAELIVPDDGSRELKNVILIRIADIALIGWGLLTLVFRRRPVVRKANLAVFCLLLAGPLAAEGLLRVAIKAGVPAVRRPELYADYWSDDDYWKLHLRWRDDWKPGAGQIHPRLGWTQTQVTAENPFGLQEETRRRLVADGREKVLFYGDSFVAGAADPEYRIPRWLDDRIDGPEVLDLGVGGYGTDQSLLLCEATWPLAGGKPFIIMGVLLEDMDRAALTVRTARKPWFEAGPGGLELRGLPIETDQERFVQDAPLDSWSLLGCLLARRVRPQVYGERHARRAAKERVNRLIIDRALALARKEQFRLLYVLFYSEWQLGETGWREEFLKTELGARAIPFVDTKRHLIEAAQVRGIPRAAFYDHARGGHHGNLGNEVIAEGVLAALRDLGIR